MFKRNSLNLFSLVAIQGSNAVLPLLIFPYILKVLGENMYSKIVIAESIMFITYAFILYSFEVDGVSKVIRSIELGSKKSLSKLYTEILVIRLFIFGLFLIGFLIAGFFLEKDFFLLLLFWMLYPLSFILQSSYFYLGAEKNFPLAVTVVTSRLVCAFFIFYSVNIYSPAFLIPLIIGGSFLVGGIASFLHLHFCYDLKISKISLRDLKDILKEGKEIFIGNISVLLFRDLNVLIISAITSNAVAISSYSIAEKIVKSLQASIRPLNQFFFPKGLRMIKDIELPNMKSFKILGKVTIIQLICLLIVSVTLGIVLINFKDQLSFLKTTPNINFIITLCLIMITSVFFGVMNFMFGTVGLNHLNSKKYFAFAILITGIVSVTSSFLLIYFFDAYGAAFNFVLAEVVLFGMIFRKYFFNNHLTIDKNKAV
jgi:PST family polysaccharide transporter